MPEILKRSHFTSVVPRFQRSINLYNDWRDTEISSGYIITPNVAQSLRRLFHGILTPKGQRAFALTGPYGTGKSAFAVFVSQLFARDCSLAAKAENLLSCDLKSMFKKVRESASGGSGFLIIPVTARRRPVAQLILEGMLIALSELQQINSTKELYSKITAALSEKAWQDTSVILKFVSALINEAKKQDFSGILLFIDEAGKTLEYALQDRSGGDVYIFQELAEYANRQTQLPVLFIISLHQMFDDYVELSDRTLRNEWNKVQERFQSIQFTESAAATMRLIAAAFQRTKKLPSSVHEEIDAALQQIQQGAMPLPIGIDFSEFKEMAHRVWPLHPSVLLAMPYLFRRLAQNERSIFSYLTSQEPYSLQDHLNQPFGADDDFIRLHHIYTYFLSNFEAGLARLPYAKRLLEANDIINSRQRLSPAQLNLIRSIAMLNVLSEICPLRATTQTLDCVTSYGAAIEQELHLLKQQSILTYRRFDGSYRVWEGSDVDIEARMNEGRRKLQMEGMSPLEALCQHLPKRTIVARRHGLETGIYRYFNLIYAENLGQATLREAENYGDAAGTIVVLLPQADSKALETAAKKETKRNNRLIVALPRQIDALRGVVEEVTCLRWVEENTEELRDDRIARRELSLRLAMGEQRIAQLLQTLLDPRPAPVGNSCQWIWQGEDCHPQRPVDVARLLSNACDAIYHKSPRIRNELVVRKKISSAAASARRCLLERMLTHRAEERLGIDGYPPERSIYESVLRATGIHAFNPNTGQWEFRPPPEDNDRCLRFCWDMMEKEIFAGTIRRVQLVDLFQKMADVPYGLPDGVHPILFTAFYLCYQNELFLYREGTFVPDIHVAHLELLQRRPDLFAVSGARLDGTRKAVVNRLARGLRQPPQTASVVRALYRILNTLPQVTLKTARIKDDAAMKMRDCLLQATSPEELLFVDLPACFGLQPFEQGEDRQEDMDRFFECLNNSLSVLRDYADELLKECRDILLRECGLPSNQEGWYELERRVAWLAPRVKHEILTPFLNCIHNGIIDGHDVRPALSFIAKRPFEQWTDMDIQEFNGLAKGVGNLFQQIWHNYRGPGKNGGLDLTDKERKQKEKLRKALSVQLHKISRNHSPKVIAAALRELLEELALE